MDITSCSRGRTWLHARGGQWEDKLKRLLLRFERIQQRHYGMKFMAYMLMYLREFCGT